MPGVRPVLVVLVVIEGIISEMTGVVAVQIGSERALADGPLGKSDRAFLFGFIGLLLGCGVKTGLWLDGLLVAAIVLLLLTIVNRRPAWSGGSAGVFS